MNQPKISVIIPVYQIEPYLRRCVESVIHQTLRDIEIILVDDGSTDNGPNICDEYAKQDDRIKVVHKPNQGISCARNNAIQLSTAPYIMLVDSDDWVEPELCEKPWKAAEHSGADLVLFLYCREWPDGHSELIDTDLQTGLLTERDAIKYNMCVATVPWIALYRKKLFRNIQYPEGKYYEDMGTSYKLIHAADRIFLIDEALYHRRMNRPGSITTDSRTREHPDKQEMNYARLRDLCNWGYSEYVFIFYFPKLIKYGIRSEEEKFFLDVIKKEKVPGLLTWKQKAMVYLLRISPVLFDAFCIITGKRLKTE